MSDWQALTKKDAPPVEAYVVEIAGNPYFIDWDVVHRGSSFIIPTVASASMVAGALSPAASFFRMQLFCEEILWYGMTAVRVHRIS